jgi:hypothetical protein
MSRRTEVEANLSYERMECNPWAPVHCTLDNNMVRYAISHRHRHRGLAARGDMACVAPLTGSPLLRYNAVGQGNELSDVVLAQTFC